MTSELRQHKLYQSKKEFLDRKFHKRYASATERFPVLVFDGKEKEREAEIQKKGIDRNYVVTLPSGATSRVKIILLNKMLWLENRIMISPFDA